MGEHVKGRQGPPPCPSRSSGCCRWLSVATATVCLRLGRVGGTLQSRLHRASQGTGRRCREICPAQSRMRLSFRPSTFGSRICLAQPLRVPVLSTSTRAGEHVPGSPRRFCRAGQAHHHALINASHSRREGSSPAGGLPVHCVHAPHQWCFGWPCDPCGFRWPACLTVHEAPRLKQVTTHCPGSPETREQGPAARVGSAELAPSTRTGGVKDQSRRSQRPRMTQRRLLFSATLISPGLQHARTSKVESLAGLQSNTTHEPQTEVVHAVHVPKAAYLHDTTFHAGQQEISRWLHIHSTTPFLTPARNSCIDGSPWDYEGLTFLASPD